MNNHHGFTGPLDDSWDGAEWRCRIRSAHLAEARTSGAGAQHRASTLSPGEVRSPVAKIHRKPIETPGPWVDVCFFCVFEIQISDHFPVDPSDKLVLELVDGFCLATVRAMTYKL